MPGLSELQLPYYLRNLSSFSLLSSFVRYTKRQEYIPVLLHQVCTYHQILYAVGSHARPAQISLGIYSPAAQRSAVRCGAVPFAAVLCRCAVCFLSKIEQYRV